MKEYCWNCNKKLSPKMIERAKQENNSYCSELCFRHHEGKNWHKLYIKTNSEARGLEDKIHRRNMQIKELKAQLKPYLDNENVVFGNNK